MGTSWTLRLSYVLSINDSQQGYSFLDTDLHHLELLYVNRWDAMTQETRSDRPLERP